jgi:hypothetical protein
MPSGGNGKAESVTGRVHTIVSGGVKLQSFELLSTPFSHGLLKVRAVDRDEEPIVPERAHDLVRHRRQLSLKDCGRRGRRFRQLPSGVDQRGNGLVPGLSLGVEHHLKAPALVPRRIEAGDWPTRVEVVSDP